MLNTSIEIFWPNDWIACSWFQSQLTALPIRPVGAGIHMIGSYQLLLGFIRLCSPSRTTLCPDNYMPLAMIASILSAHHAQWKSLSMWFDRTLLYRFQQSWLSITHNMNRFPDNLIIPILGGHRQSVLAITYKERSCQYTWMVSPTNFVKPSSMHMTTDEIPSPFVFVGCGAGNHWVHQAWWNRYPHAWMVHRANDVGSSSVYITPDEVWSPHDTLI